MANCPQQDSILREDLNGLSVSQIISFISPLIPIPRSCQRSKPRLLQFILENAPLSALQQLQEEALNRPTGRRRKAPNLANSVKGTSTTYMDLPTVDQLHHCYAEFYDGTSNASLRRHICGVCGREDDLVLDERVHRRIPLKLLPNAKKLRPSKIRPQMKLFEGLLLEEAGVFQHHGELVVNVCDTCHSDLLKGTNQPPRFSLANNLWVGPIPECVAALSFAESLLISLYIPRAFVFKLYPKLPTHEINPDELQRGMRGNIVSYDQDVQGIASMISGGLLPRPLAVLATVVTVAFIGKGKITVKALGRKFTVRRQLVRKVLEFFIHFNPYYSHIRLDEGTLSSFPEDDIPLEISSMVRHMEDESVITRETAPYVPEEDMEESSIPGHQHGEVFPLQVSGGTDVDMHTVSPHDLFQSGIANLWAQGQEGAYAVRHGETPVRDFPSVRDAEERNYFALAFPTLFPYGEGTPNNTRPVPLDLKSHAQWSLRYFDRRFRRHETYPFVMYGILRKKELLTSTRVQMQRAQFEHDAQQFSGLQQSDLEAAAEEEKQHKKISNPIVANLFRQIHSVSSRVQGSMSSKCHLRSQAWATMFCLNPAALWLTINPCDLHNPIAQVLAGHEIDMDCFQSVLGPTASERAHTIAADPYAAAQFFHYLIRLVLRTLFQIDASSYQVHSSMGVLGELAGYFGAVESQGRGSLHLHMLLWLKHAPTAEQMHLLLETSSFRDQVRRYIAANIHAYQPGLESAESVRMIPNHVDIAYSRPPHPKESDFDKKFQQTETLVARAKQIHTCSESRCLVYNKRTHRYRCKRRAPFECAQEAFVDASGKWGPKRLYNMVNGYCPHLSVFLPCNNDLKLITNGQDTRNCTFYFTTYMTKNQPTTTNLSVIVARQYAFEQQRLAVDPRYLQDIQQQQRMLLYRIASRMNAEQELSGPMVISYLMNWGDTFTSHRFTTVYWGSFVGHLLRVYPNLKRHNESQHHETNTDCEGRVDTEESHDESLDDVELLLDVNGCLKAKNQVTDYVYRGEVLSNYSVFEFFKDTWEERQSYRSRNRETVVNGGTSHRAPHNRIPYLPEHPACGTRSRVLRSDGHNNLPNFIGHYFPRNDDPLLRSFYCASMLLLFKPWRRVHLDLKNPNQTWEEAWEVYLENANAWIHPILSNIQYYYESRSAAEDHEAEELDISRHDMYTQTNEDTRHESLLAGPVGEESDEEFDPEEEEQELELREALATEARRPDEMYAATAVALGELCGLFPKVCGETHLPQCSYNYTGQPHRAEGEDLMKLATWKKLMEEPRETQPNITSSMVQTSVSSRDPQPPAVFPLVHLPLESNAGNGRQTVTGDQALSLPKPFLVEEVPGLSTLNLEQRRQYEMVKWALDRHLAGFEVPPLRMQLLGEPGVGKSRVIQAITELFRVRGLSHMLAKAAYTGIAAVIIHGDTIHHLCRLPVKGSGRFHIGPKTQRDLVNIFRTIWLLIIDELSMVWKLLLALISHRISVGKAAENPNNIDQTFGGIHVLLAGDLHQFPPVSVKRFELLYKPLPLFNVSPWTKLGDMLYHEFDKVVILKEQIRVQDPIWQEFLGCLRHGRVRPDHIEMLRTLILKPGEVEENNVTNNPWLRAPLITPRHSVRKAWNAAALRRHCVLHHQTLFICPAHETIDGIALTTRERHILRECIRDRVSDGNRKDLDEKIEVAIGAEVLVTRNLDTDLDVANGARGEIVDIVFHPDEPHHEMGREVELRFPPAYILVKLEQTRATTLPGLPPQVLPFEPLRQKVNIKVRNPQGGTPLQKQVIREQLPMTTAYAFTDYRAEGQTLPYVIVDIAKPATGPGLSMFNLYVALSRSRGRERIRLLRDFDAQAFFQKVDLDLEAEDARLQLLDQQTLKWWEEIQRT